MAVWEPAPVWTPREIVAEHTVVDPVWEEIRQYVLGLADLLREREEELRSRGEAVVSDPIWNEILVQKTELMFGIAR